MRPPGLAPLAVILPLAVAAALGTAACGGDDDVSVPIGDGSPEYDSAALARARYDTMWHMWAERDRRVRSGGGAADAATDDSLAAAVDTAIAESPVLGPGEPESPDDITPATVNAPARLPIDGDDAGPSVLRVQILLDRAGFSPGILDGRWGKNTEKAAYWFQHSRGLEATGTIDEATYARLEASVGAGAAVVAHRVERDDVDGPYVSIPADVYEKAELACLCYESRAEQLAEAFHTSPAMLERLNRGVDLDGVEAGARLRVPNVRRPDEREDGEAAGEVARIVVSRNGYYTQALDADDAILLHFPSTLGSRYDPSPTGNYRVVAITRDPHFHYQPALFHEVPDERPEAMLPPGPNSPVGVVWMALSKPHYGIHGTPAPETIGYTSSHGCIRLTNWDARHLADRTPEGTPVDFR
ncbi:MAG: L,D-transpeptidase family protein [Gemmatimonadota bacterium]